MLVLLAKPISGLAWSFRAPTRAGRVTWRRAGRSTSTGSPQTGRKTSADGYLAGRQELTSRRQQIASCQPAWLAHVDGPARAMRSHLPSQRHLTFR